MKDRSSALRQRLARALGLRLLGTWILVSLLVTAAVRHELDEIYDASLVAIAEVVSALDRGGSAAVATADQPFESLDIGFRLYELDPAIADTPNLGANELQLRERLETSDGVRRLRFSTAAAVNRAMQISQDLYSRRDAMLEVALAILVIPILVVAPLSFLWFGRILNRELQPLDALGAAIGERGSKDLTAIDVDDLPAELGRLEHDVNHLLDRLRRALEAERNFASNSAHELRTPIAGALAQVQRLLSETDDEAVLARALSVESALRQLQRLATRLLELARADGAGVITATRTDLAPVLRLALQELEREFHAADRMVTDPGELPLMSYLDPDAFYVLMRNLIENALRHGDPHGCVYVTRRGRTLEVINAGTALSVEEFERLGERFVRGTTATPRPGTGLGLAIVRSVVTGGDIDLEVESPCDGRGGGVCIRVTLPVASTVKVDVTGDRARTAH